MRQLILGLTLVFGFAGAAFAQSEADDAMMTIQRQIEAFMKDDFETAFTYASPGVQSIFQTPDQFRTMVQNGFPMVWRPSAVVFGATRAFGDMQLQLVDVADEAGARYLLEYQMVRTAEGWRVAGVRILTDPRVGA